MRRFLLAVVMCGTASARRRPTSPIFRSPRRLHRGLGARGQLAGRLCRRPGRTARPTWTTPIPPRTCCGKLVNNSSRRSAVQRIELAVAAARRTRTSTAFGAFAGYNMQWTDAWSVSKRITAMAISDFQYRLADADLHRQHSKQYDQRHRVVASMSVTDFGSLRVRGGYAVGSFLPYGFVGVGLGQADINRSVRACPVRHSAGMTNPALRLSALEQSRTMRTPIWSRLLRRARLRLDVCRRPVPARRVGISPFHLDGRNHHQHRPRRPRLQVLIVGSRPAVTC